MNSLKLPRVGCVSTALFGGADLSLRLRNALRGPVGYPFGNRRHRAASRATLTTRLNALLTVTLHDGADVLLLVINGACVIGGLPTMPTDRR